ncbi:hypothetical protein BDZ97DRAFT_1757024 [Flammula alnicola]|nr:hypothetical protein BDZ97DRAFT_1757024 [Flammula alnicola]
MDAAEPSTPLPPPPPANLINTIPPELLGEIFAYSSLHDADAPLTLGAVCRTFQRVAHTTPQAWTRLHLQAARATRTPGMSALDEDARWIRKAELWFAMGGTCLVDLRVEIGVSAPVVVHQNSSSTPGAVVDGQGHGKKKVQHLDSTGRDAGDVQLLPHVLHEFRQRIAGLELRSSTVDEAQRFFGALYPPGTLLLPLPLERLTFHASPDAPHPQAHLRHKHAPATCVSLSHCHFPHLAHLRFVNHPLPDVSAQNLRSLAITYPIRFPPISVYTVLQILRSAPLLEKLEIEGRVVDSPRHAHPSSSPTVPSATTAHHTRTSSTTSFTTTSTPTPTNTPTHTPPPPHPDLTLITLPHLALLSLRINNLPALLTHLLLPALHTLRIDDLDGKRAGAAAQTGSVLRQVLVRMELPCAGVLPQRSGRSGRGGLEVLDMCGVAVAGAGGAGGGGGGAGGVDAADAVWAWCFRRMRALRELRASKMDTGALLALITPQMTTTTGRRTHAEADDVVLPSLQKLVVFDCSNSNSNSTSDSSSSSEASVSPPSSPGSSPPLSPPSPPISSSPSSSSHFIPSTSGPILKFQLRRPDVHVEYHRMPDPAAVLPPNVDFLELYCHGAMGAAGVGGVGAGAGR